MIKQLWVKNYRSLADVTVDFEPITVLVGQNGVGKSNIVDVLRFIRDAVSDGLNNAILKRHGSYTLYRWSTKAQPDDIEIGLTIETDTWHSHYTFALGGPDKMVYWVKREACHIHDKIVGKHYNFEINEANWVQRPPDLTPAIPKRALVLPLIADLEPYKKLYDFLTGFSFYNIKPTELIQPQQPANPYPLQEDGRNIASTLWEMQQVHSQFLSPLRSAIRAVIPDIIDFQVKKDGGYMLLHLIHDMANKGEARFDMVQESEGTLRMLGILVALYQDHAPALLGLEEPELNIHPGILALLWDEIEVAAERSQILVTTHSPDLLDLCQAEQLQMVEKINGVTVIAPIEVAQKEAIQERLFAPGELLRAHGLRRAEQLSLL